MLKKGIRFSTWITKSQFSTKNILEDIPIIETRHLLDNTSQKLVESQKLAESFHKYGVGIIRDPRIDKESNDVRISVLTKFLDFFRYNGKIF